MDTTKSATSPQGQLPPVDSGSAVFGTVQLDANEDRMALVEGLKRALAHAEDEYEPPVPGASAEGASQGKQPMHLKKNRDVKVSSDQWLRMVPSCCKGSAFFLTQTLNHSTSLGCRP